MIIWKDKDLVPKLFFEAMRRDTHTVAGDISVSELISPPQVRILRKQNDVIESATKRIFTLIGTAIHSLLENGAFAFHKDIKALMEAGEVLDSLYNKYRDNPKGQNFADLSAQLKKIAVWMIEDIGEDMESLMKKYRVESTMVLKYDDTALYGTCDLIDFDDNAIEDYKLTKSWFYTYAKEKEDWVAQLNIYRLMAKRHGIVDATVLNTWAFFRDWAQGVASTNPAYPKHPVLKIGQMVWTDEKTEEYIQSRLHVHRLAEQGHVQECSGIDRWATGSLWKLKIPNGVKSLKNFDNEANAIDALDDYKLMKNPAAYLDFVPGQSRRCEEWCSVAHVCPQFAEIKRKIKIQGRL